MKRDFDLIRKLLLFFEDKANGDPLEIPKIENYSDLEIKYHLILLYEAGLLSCETVTSQSTPDRVIYVIPFWLTWRGHEFVDASRNDKIWIKITGKIREQGLNVTFAVLQKLLIESAKQVVGI